uniref:Triadin n=1 Tax=Meloidogyne hapla TaxID=6305 RepID=A0A1I8B2E5_MELHA
MFIISVLALHSLLVVFVIDSFITCLCIRLRKIKEQKEQKLLLYHQPPPTEESKQPPPPKSKIKPTKEEKKPPKAKEGKKPTIDKEKPAKKEEEKPFIQAPGLYDNLESAREKTPPKEERPKEITARSSRDIAPSTPPALPPEEKKKSKRDQKGNQDFANHGEEKGEEKGRQEEAKEEKAIRTVLVNIRAHHSYVSFFLRSSTSGASSSNSETEKPSKEPKGRTVIQASFKNILFQVPALPKFEFKQVGATSATSATSTKGDTTGTSTVGRSTTSTRK